MRNRLDNTEEAFLLDHPGLMKLEESKDKDILLWAHKAKYINLTQVGDKYYFSLYNLETAMMWYEKIFS